MSNDPKQVLNDLQAFPVLTQEIDYTRTQQSSASGISSVGYMAESALRDILSIRPTTADPKSFLAALNNAFTVTEVDGRQEWKWMPRSFTVQADMGEVTGAQASIHARAKFAFDQCVLLLEGLDSLRADADHEDVDATRSIVRSHLLELVNELGMVGGPRVQRVDALFAALLGPNKELNDPAKVRGLLGSIRDRLGLTRDQVNTIDEEQNLTNFLILVDHVIALRLSWNAQRAFFDRRGKDVFLGTQLVLLGRALEVIAESVHEAEFIMDSVLLGPAERQTLDLDFKNKLGKNQTTLKIAELLSWLEYFAAQEGPRIIREAGKDGVIALVPTLAQLHKLVGFARDISLLPSTNPTRGFHTPRVQLALEELTQHVGTALDLATGVERLPVDIEVVDPVHAALGSAVPLFIFGENFQSDAQARLQLADGSGKTIKAASTHFISQGALRATFDLHDQTPGTTWHVLVVNPDGTRDRKKNAFTIDDDLRIRRNRAASAQPPAPQVNSISPRQSSNADANPTRIVVEGTDLDPQATVLLRPDQSSGGQEVAATTTRVIADQGLILADFDLQGYPAGTWRVVVTNPDGNTAFAPFTIIDSSTGGQAAQPATARSALRVQSIQFLRGQTPDASLNLAKGATDVVVAQDVDTVRMAFSHYVRPIANQAGGSFRLVHESGDEVAGMIDAASQKVVNFAIAGSLPPGSYRIIAPDDSVAGTFNLQHRP